MTEGSLEFWSPEEERELGRAIVTDRGMHSMNGGAAAGGEKKKGHMHIIPPRELK